MASVNVDPHKCLELIEENKNNPDFVILDVRGPGEHAQGHVKNAVLIELQSPDFKARLEELDKNKTYLVYCRSGMRSSKAAKIMADMGFSNIYTMEGGFTNWSACGLPEE
ncbi:MAG: rhodanese-like domain-containing protein [Methanobacteriaceae archaeon]